MRKKQDERNITENPLYHDTWKLLDSSVDLLRNKHKNGEVYYWLIYYTFLSPQQFRNVVYTEWRMAAGI